MKIKKNFAWWILTVASLVTTIVYVIHEKPIMTGVFFIITSYSSFRYFTHRIKNE